MTIAPAASASAACALRRASVATSPRASVASMSSSGTPVMITFGSNPASRSSRNRAGDADARTRDRAGMKGASVRGEYRAPRGRRRHHRCGRRTGHGAEPVDGEPDTPAVGGENVIEKTERLVLDELTERLDTLKLLRAAATTRPTTCSSSSAPGARSKSTCSGRSSRACSPGVSGTVRRGAPHRVRALEVFDRNGGRRPSTLKAGVLTPIAAPVVQQLVRIIVRGYQKTVIDRLARLYARREANLVVGTPEFMMLRMARTLKPTGSRPASRRQRSGLPTFLVGGAAVSAVGSSLQGLVVAAIGSPVVLLIVAGVFAALALAAFWCIFQAAAIARRRAPSVLIARCAHLGTGGCGGSPPRERKTRQFATYAVLLLVAGVDRRSGPRDDRLESLLKDRFRCSCPSTSPTSPLATWYAPSGPRSRSRHLACATRTWRRAPSSAAWSCRRRRRRGPGRVWDDDAGLDVWLESSPLARLLEPGFRVRLAPLRAHGSWPGLDADVPESRHRRTRGRGGSGHDRAHEVDAATAFFKASNKAEKAVVDAPGLIWATGLGKPPFFATFSLWESTRLPSTYGTATADRGHPDAMAVNDAKPFHHESAFIRFRPYDAHGVLGGKNPLRFPVAGG